MADLAIARARDAPSESRSIFPSLAEPSDQSLESADLEDYSISAAEPSVDNEELRILRRQLQDTAALLADAREESKARKADAQKLRQQLKALRSEAAQSTKQWRELASKRGFDAREVGKLKESLACSEIRLYQGRTMSSSEG